MKELLIQTYLFVCQVYNTSEASCFQRMSNNQKPVFTDQEIVTIWMFAHLNDKFQKKQMHQFIQEYWAEWFPALPSYQTFVYRLNQLEPTFQTLGAYLQAQVTKNLPREIDTLVDSLPIMLAQQGHSYTAKVARDLADSGYCAAKKTRFHGLRLHVLAQRRAGKLPVPNQVWLCAASHHDVTVFKELALSLPQTTVLGDKAYADQQLSHSIAAQDAQLLIPCKKPKTRDLTATEKYQSRLVNKLRQPIESLFNWFIQKTDIQRASKVRSSDALLVHCWGKLAVAFFLLSFNS